MWKGLPVEGGLSLPRGCDSPRRTDPQEFAEPGRWAASMVDQDWRNGLRARFPSVLAEQAEIRCGAGWAELLNELCDQLQCLANTGAGQPVAIQVKEKLGALCFYFHVVYPNADAAGSRQQLSEADPDARASFDALVDAARRRSREICELCGRRGRLRREVGILATRCDTHARPGWESADIGAD